MSTDLRMTEPRVTDILSQGFRVSVELVPSMVDRAGHPLLTDVMSVLARTIEPSFISVTQGAGGSSREQSPALVRALEPYGIPRCAHLICGYALRAEVLRHAAEFYSLGVRNFLVLKGDRPEGSAEGDYLYAADCIRDLRALYPDVCLGGGAYPDTPSELPHLRAKHCDFAITQMCFDPATYSTLARAVAIPVIPGVCFLHSPEHAAQFAARFKVRTPPQPPNIPALIEQFREAGAPGVHLFLLNDLGLVHSNF